MANVIKLKRGTSTPTTSDITSGEVALDTSAQKLYVNDSGTVKEIGGGSAGMTAESSTPKNTHSNNAAGALTSDSINNVLIGWNAGNAISTGDNNTVLGYRAGGVANNSEETIIGANSFSERGNHIRAVGLGFGSGRWNRGTDVTAIGYEALYNGSDSSNSKENTAVGFRALYGDNSDSSGNSSTAVGYKALYARSTGDNNSALGHSALVALTTGAGNCSMGHEAGNAITTGSNNCVLGTDAANSGTNDLTTGSNNIIIGYNAAASAATVSNEITFGDTNITKLRVPALSFEITASAVTNGGAFYENAKTVTADYTLSGSNAMAAGPITVNSGITVTVSSGDTLTIV